MKQPELLNAALESILVTSGAQCATYAYRFANGTTAGGAWGSFEVAGESHQPTLQTPFDLASLTKLFTATAVLQLVERGELTLEQSVQSILPDFQRLDVSIAHLLSHTSMLDVYLSHIRAHSPTTSALRKGILRAGKQDGHYFYQDPNMILLGWVVEQATGMRLDQYMARAIFEPLHMHNSGFNLSATNIPATRITTDGRLNTGVVHDDTARIFGGISGHAGLFSSAEDILLFLNAWNNRDERLLLPETINNALQVRYAADDGNFAQALGWKVHSPRHNVAPFFRGGYMHGGFTGTYCCMSDELEMVILTDFVYPGERPQEERDQWWHAMRACVQLLAKSGNDTFET